MPDRTVLTDPDSIVPDQIRAKARRLVAREIVSAEEREDLQQELAAEVLRTLDRFDPDRGELRTFLDHVLDNFITSWLRHRFAEKRGGGQIPVSLDWPRVDDRGRVVAWGRTIPESTRSNRRGGTEPPSERADLVIDVRLVIEELPDPLRQLAERLGRMSPHAAGRELGWSRRRVRRGLDALRAYCERAGLRAYRTGEGE